MLRRKSAFAEFAKRRKGFVPNPRIASRVRRRIGISPSAEGNFCAAKFPAVYRLAREGSAPSTPGNFLRSKNFRRLAASNSLKKVKRAAHVDQNFHQTDESRCFGLQSVVLFIDKTFLQKKKIFSHTSVCNPFLWQTAIAGKFPLFTSGQDQEFFENSGFFCKKPLTNPSACGMIYGYD